MSRFYVTTPIYYVSDVPHIGHAYTTIVCDALARYHRLRGDATMFLTGTDEHGLKIARLAEAAQISPRHYADKFADAYRATWKALEVSNDDFIRTTDADHEAMVQTLWRAMEKNGFIYSGDYEGWYCVSCERFYTEKELLPGNICPDHKRPVELVKEQSFYFKLSAFTQPLLELYEKHPEFIQPANRRNEVMAFVKEGLRDLSISRTTFAWGVPVPDHPKHIVYVWLDALTNYYSATQRSAERKAFWPDKDSPGQSQIVHIIGKEISRFHAVYWPAFLLAAGWRLPTTIFAHGWWTVDGEKMSKTLGNVVDPLKLANDLGVDALRYFVLREVPLGADGDFNHEAFIQRYNSELANDFGNLLNRTLGMVHKYGLPPQSSATDPFDVEKLKAGYAAQLDLFQPSKALEEIWALVRRGNGYIDEKAPWKPESPRAEILGNVLELLRVLSHLLEPFLPERALAVRAQLGVDEKTAWPTWGPRTFSPLVGTPLFPRVDDDRKKELLDRWRASHVAAAPKAAAATATATTASDDGRITFEQFGKVDLRVAKVVAAEAIPKAKKLLKLTVDVGGETRQVVAGIAEAYPPETLIGKSVIFVANLQPATIRGVESQGMILAAGDDKILGLSGLDREVPPGDKGALMNNGESNGNGSASSANSDIKRVKRRDARIEVAWEVQCEKTSAIEQQLHPALAAVYERVHADPTEVGKRFVATLRDLSVNGAFVEGEPLPLLSRVALSIDVPSYKPIDIVGWVLWRRTAACTVTRASGAPVTLGAGFGVIFEWISLEARLEIARRVALLV